MADFRHSYGRERRRRPTVEERRAIFARAGGRCQSCGDPLHSNYHNAHLVQYDKGHGATTLDNIEPWCVPCNLKFGARSVEDASTVIPRAWQTAAMEVIFERLYQTGVATLNAAPGAGKTIFAALIYRLLADLGLVERIVVVVPTLVIVDQWKRALGKLRIHVDTEPRDGHLEHPKTCGAVVTYHLLPRVADLHRERLDEVPTLVIFDEVHHIAENRSWGDAVQRMVGDVSNGTVHPAGVLNMTGTLFRSGRDKRISTVRYITVANDIGEEKLEAAADWSISTADLIGHDLRAPQLYVYTSRAQLVDHHKETVVTGEIGDLDKQQRETALRGLDSSPGWVRGYALEAIRLLNNQLRAIEHQEPLKLLYCATDIRAAELAATAINEVTGQDFARLVHSKLPRAKEKLSAAAAERRPCAIVQVDMASEGFDCPQVSTVAYASNVTAPLRIAQVMARAMRLTDSERASKRMVPAQILIPDNSDLRNVFSTILATIPRLIDIEDPPDWCRRCGAPNVECVCATGPIGGAPGFRRYELIDLTAPQFRLGEVVGHPDGIVLEPELTAEAPGLLSMGIPEVYHMPAIVWHRQRSPWSPLAGVEPLPSDVISSVTVEEINPRDLNRLHRAKLTQAARWMRIHIDHDGRFDTVNHFQYSANDAAGIPTGGRDMASSSELKLCARWMCEQVRQHCATHSEQVPMWAREQS